MKKKSEIFPVFGIWYLVFGNAYCALLARDLNELGGSF